MKSLKPPLYPVIAAALLLFLIGCALPKKPGETYHPVKDEDVSRVTKGEAFEAGQDGWFMSDFYLTNVVGIQIKE